MTVRFWGVTQASACTTVPTWARRQSGGPHWWLCSAERSERDIRLGLSERGSLCGLRRRDFGLEKGAKDRDDRRGCGYPGTETYHSM
jgi:hypothetical protein